MTNTAWIDKPGTETEIRVCGCCRIAVANADTSGCDNPDAHETGAYARWGEDWRIVITGGEGVETDLFDPEPCDLCGLSGCNETLLFPAEAVARVLARR